MTPDSQKQPEGLNQSDASLEQQMEDRARMQMYINDIRAKMLDITENATQKAPEGYVPLKDIRSENPNWRENARASKATKQTPPQEPESYEAIKDAVVVEWQKDAIAIQAKETGKMYLTATGEEGSDEVSKIYPLAAGDTLTVPLADLVASRPLNVTLSFTVDGKKKYQLEEHTYTEALAA